MHVANSAQRVYCQSSLILDYVKELISRRSITPFDAGCQAWIASRSERLGFECEHWQNNGVSNMIAKIGTGDRRVAFAGHTDVVPAGNEDEWEYPAFEASEVNNVIFGRGIADMKGAIAAMMAAIEGQVSTLNLSTNTLYFLLTSDEEGEAAHGTVEIVERLKQRNELPHLCLVGEPSSDNICGDVIKIGRRGAISGKIVVTGKQGHVAYPRYADNALHKASRLTHALTLIDWDLGTQDFPGTTLQVTHMDSGAFTDNIIPDRTTVCFNLRFSHKYDDTTIRQRISDCLAQVIPEREFVLSWDRLCLPYHFKNTGSDDMDVIEITEKAIFSCTQNYPRLSTAGGTSDGRFFANQGCQVVELGLTNKTIHQVNEQVAVRELLSLQGIYESWLETALP